MSHYEMHVTMEFPGEAEAAALKAEMQRLVPWWHMGDLLLMKTDDERSHKDLFFTAREETEIGAWITVKAFCDLLRERGHKVLRYKLEDTIVDSRIQDQWELLG